MVAVGDLGRLGAVGGERGEDLGDDRDVAGGAGGRHAEGGGRDDGEGGELHFGGVVVSKNYRTRERGWIREFEGAEAWIW